MIAFDVGDYQVKRLSKAGLWLVTTKQAFDIAMLFLRVQEFYESANPAFVGQPFSLLDYMRWYSLNLSSEKSFTYASDFEGFNVPSTAIDACFSLALPDPNRFDVLMGRITAAIRAQQVGPYYLIGAREGDDANIEHEIAHGMFFLTPEYRERATALVETLPQREEIFTRLRKEGYGESVLVDEVQAYLSTGLFQDILHLEHIRHPFMKLHATYRKKLITRKQTKGSHENPIAGH
jgi:hypothetical protein